MNRIICGDTKKELSKLPDNYVDTIITSPPYWGLRDYGITGQIGLEKTLEEYIGKLLAITTELKRILKPTGVMFWNHGDCYGGNPTGSMPNPDKNFRSLRTQAAQMKCQESLKSVNGDKRKYEKCLMLQNYRLILRMIDEQGWILRNDIKWHKPNSMPSSVKDRFATSYEPVFMLVKNKKYWFDLDAVRLPHQDSSIERAKYKSSKRKDLSSQALYKKRWNVKGMALSAGKNPGDLWTIPTQPFPEAHFATFPEKLIEPMIKAACPEWICKKCGKARVRITEKEYKQSENKWGKQTRPKQEKTQDKKEGYRPSENLTKIVKTIGWTDCGCKAGWRPGIALDPFGGAGTVGVVAKKLGRSYIIIDLKPEYCQMAEKRIANTMGRLL